MNKALSENLQAARLVIRLNQQAEQSAAERQQNHPDIPDYPSARAEDLTDDQLAWIIMNGPEYAALKDY